LLLLVMFLLLLLLLLRRNPGYEVGNKIGNIFIRKCSSSDANDG
jgi:hypothetical protein